METQKDNYDIFIYCEDDLLFTKKNFKYWLENKDKCIENNYNLGFLRVEMNKKNKILYSTDQVETSNYYVELKNKKYLVLANSNCSFWIYDKYEFNEFIKTKYWRFDWRWISISDILLIREMAAVGWHGQNMNGLDMGRYSATIVPLKKGKLENKSFIRHLPDNYANAPRGLFGTFKMNDIVKKDDALTYDPNVGGFGQGETEIVLQNPNRVKGMIVFFFTVTVTQILLVLKKKQFEKVQAAEMNF